MLDKIHLFLPSGKTFTFTGVDVVTDNESYLVFDYKAMSDGRNKRLAVNKAQIIGWSFTKPEPIEITESWLDKLEQ